MELYKIKGFYKQKQGGTRMALAKEKKRLLQATSPSRGGGEEGRGLIIQMTSPMLIRKFQLK